MKFNAKSIVLFLSMLLNLLQNSGILQTADTALGATDAACPSAPAE